MNKIKKKSSWGDMGLVAPGPKREPKKKARKQKAVRFVFPDKRNERENKGEIGPELGSVFNSEA